MQTDIWGPSAWKFLHMTVHNYPIQPTIEDKNAYSSLFATLKTTLPCCYCTKSFTLFYDNIHITQFLETRIGLIAWLYCIHNFVNLKLGKKIMDLKDALAEYEQYRVDKNEIVKHTDELFNKYFDIMREELNTFIKYNMDKEEIKLILNTFNKKNIE